MAATTDYHTNKDMRSYERDRQRRRKPADRSKNRFNSVTKDHSNGGTLRAGREKLHAPKVVAMHHEAVSCITGQNWGEGSADKAWEEVEYWTPARVRDERHQVELLHIAKPARKKRKNATKDFVVVPSLPRVRFLDEDTVWGLDGDSEEDDFEWEVVINRPSRLAGSYAAVTRA